MYIFQHELDMDDQAFPYVTLVFSALAIKSFAVKGIPLLKVRHISYTPYCFCKFAKAVTFSPVLWNCL